MEKKKFTFDKFKNKKKLLIYIAIIAVIAMIPMMYSITYLSAFWDPYNKINNVPVAFVNMDKSVDKDGKVYNIGEELQKNLESNNKVQWNFVSYDEAKNGVEGTKYYAMIVIPEDFSKKISDAKDGIFNRPQIQYEANKGRNYVFSQISEKVANSLKSELTQKVQEETSKVMADNLINVKDSLAKASDGASKLSDATKQLSDGSKNLTGGISQAVEGTVLLHNGMKDAANGEENLSNGIDSLLGGLNQLKQGLSQKDERVDKFVNGAHSLLDGADLIHQKTEEANEKILNGLTNASDGVNKVADYVDNANGALEQALANFKSTGKFSNEDIQKIATAQKILDGIKQKDIKTSIANPLKNTATSLNPLVGKLEELRSGVKQVADGAFTFISTAEEKQKAASDGVIKLIAGANELKAGSNKIADGLSTATGKTAELSSGLQKINDGAGALSNGLEQANSGTEELKSGLSDGYNQMNEKIKFTADNISEYMKEPITINEQNLNDVKTYGEGLAPYFISLSIWVGAMVLNSLVLTKIEPKEGEKKKFIHKFVGKYLFGSLIVLVQSILLSGILRVALGINTVSIPMFYLINALIGLVYFSIMYGLTYAFGLVAQAIVFILFVVQVSSAGGTFPIETAPTFFRNISEYLPMTYAVSTLRMVVTGINKSIMNKNIIILISFGLATLVLGFIIRKLFNVAKSATKKEIKVV